MWPFPGCTSHINPLFLWKQGDKYLSCQNQNAFDAGPGATDIIFKTIFLICKMSIINTSSSIILQKLKQKSSPNFIAIHSEISVLKFDCGFKCISRRGFILRNTQSFPPPFFLINKLIKSGCLYGAQKSMMYFTIYFFIWCSQQFCEGDVIFPMRKLKGREASISLESYNLEVIEVSLDLRRAGSNRHGA
jgi:hypothetical protein